MSKKENDEEILGGTDFPAFILIDLIDSGKPEWRRAVIKAFLADHEWKNKIENKIKLVTKENATIIGLLTGLIAIAIKIAFFG